MRCRMAGVEGSSMSRGIDFRLPSSARRTLHELDRLLDAAYGTPESELGNKEDPLDEAIYIILSFQTNLDRAKQVWEELRAIFPAWELLARAPLRRVVRTLSTGGLQGQKARTIKSLLRAVERQTGSYSLDILRALDDREVERFLLRLPGLSWKGARCVMLYSLGRAVFPVDGNTFRILKRVGIIGRGAVYRRRALHDGLQDLVEPSRRKPLHINLVVHGQRVCLPRRPKCGECPARAICRLCDVPADSKASTLGSHSSQSRGARN